MKVFQLAKEIGLTNEELIDILRQLNVKVKDSKSQISEEISKKVKDFVKKKKDIKPFKKIKIREGITIRELSDKLQIKAKDIIQRLFNKGFLVTVNQSIDSSLAEEISKEFGIEIELMSIEEEQLLKAEEKKENLVPRAPIVTVMGHVDHGKTTLLDAIRETNVVEQESGGITQHIGAYKVNVNGKTIVFIDTPGHEAFTRMRARGAKVTDLVVLVVAADDGVMPQTVEAINHAKAANVPILVAINKIDKPEADSWKVKNQLAKYGVVPEELGGDVVCVEVSAKQKTGIKDLLEMILLVSEMLELKANPNIPAQGIVLEAKLDPKRGPVATVIIQHGILRIGDAFTSGVSYGKVKSLFDENGARLNEAGPSTPVEVLGFTSVPTAGDSFQVVSNLDEAKKIVNFRLSQLEKKKIIRPRRLTLDDLYKRIEEGEIKELPLIIKADVQGSVEVLLDAIPRLSTEKVKIKIIHAAPGPISESDVLLASASKGLIIAFNIRPSRKILEIAEKEDVEIRFYNVIYKLTEDLKKAISGMLVPEEKEVYLGTAEVRKIFKVPKVGIVAGCYVTDGKIVRKEKVRVIRDNVQVYEGIIASLKRIKEDVNEVSKGYECGVAIENFNDIKVGDILESFKIEKIKPQ
ncbi:translation initiation factor IF-2 [Candidatus Aminicenantes bacterium AC-335-A11]|jgi:translation initiation factor IF-2|nr:translation initiation factor IF-2 [SCandidatus Aminicenantes bacterium Aminicenantia_JdfR_composite]MCP2597297.1 translation initiation factor IF-2 [Candidatus Aminicenantes bacterium AC-335-G13]MCP2605772.1 translation initiation factor IF-2 [Candidatus Aminicenantes bacterium AC-335-O07]MCP2618793.1 translation initiation factor IF-2 [Candidatus Aminicenantes bacterium AC-335-A11]MCP2620577.1 translation initiation factor IF-2 [Candidatus Aminicenantes bacterium AC-334-E05]